MPVSVSVFAVQVRSDQCVWRLTQKWSKKKTDHVIWYLVVSVVTSLDDGVKHVGEDGVGFLVSGHSADCVDERVPRVVHTGL